MRFILSTTGKEKMIENQDEKWMRVALQEARLALKKKEVPVAPPGPFRSQEKNAENGKNQQGANDHEVIGIYPFSDKVKIRPIIGRNCRRQFTGKIRNSFVICYSERVGDWRITK